MGPIVSNYSVNSHGREYNGPERSDVKYDSGIQ